MKKLILTILLICSSCDAEYNNLIRFYSKKHGIDFKLAKSLVRVESNFNSRAISNKNALGLTQIVFKWHKKRCNLKRKEQLFNPHINLDCGFKILKHYIKICGNIENGLACYNAGKAGARKGYGKKYAKKVLKSFKGYVVTVEKTIKKLEKYLEKNTLINFSRRSGVHRCIIWRFRKGLNISMENFRKISKALEK